MIANSTIEYFALGASVITCVYHLMLYIHQKDRYLLLYSNYLFSLALYLAFRRITDYDSFEVSDNRLAFAFDHPIILYMLASYVYFISIVLDIHNNARIIKFAVYAFYVTSFVFLMVHVYKVFFTEEAYLSRAYFLITKSIMCVFAFTGLFGAWYIRKTPFIRIIIGGGFIYAVFSVFTIVSVYYQISILGFKQYQLYFIGCLFDIMMFSSALGYRNYLMNQETITTQKLLTAESEKNKELLLNQHQILKKENDQKAAQAILNRQLQDEVGSSLSSIHVFADLSADLLQTQPEKSKEYLKRIALQGQQLMDDIGDIIWIANLSEAQKHQDFIGRIKNYSQELLNSGTIEFTLKVEDVFYKTAINNEWLRTQLSKVKAHLQAAASRPDLKKVHLSIECINDQCELRFE
ncbi:MAG: hypothetical protein IPH94_09500 [Saprospiraceae bacterium]|nr:hypothetical protein [Saprospiraceae bacterium]